MCGQGATAFLSFLVKNGMEGGKEKPRVGGGGFLPNSAPSVFQRMTVGRY
jgi:hypothetical protein